MKLNATITDIAIDYRTKYLTVGTVAADMLEYLMLFVRSCIHGDSLDTALMDAELCQHPLFPCCSIPIADNVVCIRRSYPSAAVMVGYHNFFKASSKR